jgi:3-oxoacyl-[acyl-carrier protein] reductase
MNKVTIVTGAANGIGNNLAHDLTKQGDYILVLCDIDIDKLRTEFADTDAACHRLDVIDSQNWKSLVDSVVAKHGRIDLICNIAGIVEPAWVHEAPIESIDRHIDVNVKGVLYGTKLVAEQMVRQGDGHIINIASLAGIAITPGIAFYGASKHAVRGFSLTMASELRSKGIYVTCICPGVVETGMLEAQIDRPEGAIAFAGGKPLSTAQVSMAIQKAIAKRPVEVCLPSSFFPKLVNTFPRLGARLYDRFNKIGTKSARKLRRSGKYASGTEQ